MAEAESPATDVLIEREDCVTTALANDHDRIKGLYKRYRSPSLGDDERQLVVWEMIRALCVHLYAEEEVLLPVMAKEFGQGSRDHALDVDKSLKIILSDIDGMKVGDDGLQAKVGQLMEVFFQHMAEEEHQMPELREAVPPERLLELGRKFRAAQQHVPTRPHPSAPDSLLVHIAQAPLDYFKDRFRFGATAK